MSIWDAQEDSPIRTMSRLEWPVRTLSFSHNGRLLAAASEDHLVDICNVSEIFYLLTFKTDFELAGIKFVKIF